MLTQEARSAVRGYMLSIFAIGGPIVAIVAGVAGYMINDLAKASATAQALQDIQEPLLEGNLQVAEALRNAQELEVRVAGLDQLVAKAEARAEAQIAATAEAVITRTQESVVELSEQTNAVLQEAVSARGDLNELQRLIQSVPGVQDVTETIEQEAAALASSQAFQEVVARRALEQMAGLVAAFDLPGGCPAGWSEFEAGAGRFIIGTNGSEYTLPYVAGEPKYQTGGEETHTLKVEEMPAHAHGWEQLANFHIADTHHSTGSARAGGPQMGSTLGFWMLHQGPFNNERKPLMGASGGRPDGKTEPHNNMPPYIALYFCKKGGG